MGGGTKGYEVQPLGTEEEAEELFGTTVEDVRRSHVRNVFISFHVDDEPQVNLLRSQAKDERFEIEFRDYSVKEPFDEKWKTQCKDRIAQTSMTICMIGEKTAERDAVNWELEESYRQGKKIIGVKIHKDRDDPVPKPLIEHKAPIVEWNLQEISRYLYSR